MYKKFVNSFASITMLSFLAVSAMLFTACGGGSTNGNSTSGNSGSTTSSTTKVDDSKWTSQDKENAVKNCKFGRQKDDPAKVDKLCACYLNKVIALSPNPMEQSKIPMADVTKLNADCAKEAGL